MSLREFQRAFAEVIRTPARWQQVVADPAAALREYRLSRRERARLAHIFAAPGMRTNYLLYRANRLTPLFAVLPRTCAWLGTALSEEFDAFWASSHGATMQYRREAWRFGVWIQSRIDGGHLSGGPLQDVLRFELAAYELISDHRMPTAGRHRIVPFNHDPELLLSATGPGPIPRLERPRHLLLEFSGSGLSVRHVDIPRDAHYDTG